MRSRVGEDQHRTHRVGIWSRRADQNRDVVAQQTDSRKSALTPTPTRSRDVGGVTALPHIRTLRCFVPPQRTYVDANPIAMPQHSGTAPPRWGCRYPRPRQKVSGPCATSTVPVDVQSWRSSSFCTRSPQDRRRHIRTGTGGLLGRPGRQPSRHHRLSVEWHESSSARRRSRLAWSELTVQSATHVGTFY